ncbi:hypothetical protein ACTOB_002407 [Actinoplanes oblitus]|uniref:Uncharacterized protein n=1 Tax=Actinoplanes oblitus TaxID=3040509 RepID=A0ABY8WNW5_9ACTN|nr:hypothetical protein [Actinoplanes oblitus]WIM98793.1 hypothetical protein ACTOB_002407 [Actinoplanes oblitus]
MDRPETPLSMPAYTPAELYSDTTRGLASAAYVDIEYANAVIGEVVESERKAVPPSFGFDLDPVVRHCLRGRRLLIIRYALVTAILLVGMCLGSWWTFWWLALCAVIMTVRAGRGSRLRTLRFAFFTLAGLGFTGLVLLTILVLILGQLMSAMPDWLGDRLLAIAASPTTLDMIEQLISGVAGVSLLVPIALIAAMAGTLFVSRWFAYNIMFTELAPQNRAVAPRSGNDRVERRIATVARMQRGNIAVHDTNPFAGAGDVEHGWSFAITLKKREDENERVSLDQHELNRRVNAAILGMRDTRLRDGERIPNIYTVAYVAADGSRRGDDPLIDRQTRVPLTLASAGTIAAIEACPQGGLRHYLRVVVPANGKRITGPDGSPILPAQDSGISVTAFVHLAVEGGLLYAEFVAHVLLPLRDEYRIADNLRADRILSRSWSDMMRYYVEDNLRGPWYLLSVGWDALMLSARMARSSRNADEYRFYDYGARFSVRDIAAQTKVRFREGDRSVLRIRKSMQQLDATKYIKLVDRTVTEAVISYLREQGVDTSEFEANVQNFTFGSLVLNGGQAIIGTGNVVNQTNHTKGGA